MRFTQTFLRPGRYDVNGVPFDVTSDYLRNVAANTNKAIKAGYRIPTLLEHAPVGTVGPVRKDKWDRKADKLRNTVGWVAGVSQNQDGSLDWVNEIPDAAIAKQVQSGVLSTTSPELRPGWKDGFGNAYGPMIAHAAITSTPRNPKQTALTQFSLNTPIQFGLADMAEDEKPALPVDDAPVADEVAEVADEVAEVEPEVDPMADLKPLMDAVVSKLQGLDVFVSVPEGADFKTFLEHLSTSLATHEGMRAKLEAEKPAEAPEPVDNGELKPDETVAPSPMQYSLDELQDIPGSKTVVRLAQKCVADDKKQLESLMKLGKLTPFMRDLMVSKYDTAQFSVDGEDAGTPIITWTHAEVMALLDAGVPGQAFDELQFSVIDLPPDESELADAEKAKKFVDEQAKRMPQLRK